MRQVILNTIVIVLVFMLGWLSNSLLSPMVVIDEEQPLSFSLMFNKAAERSSPSDRISESGIHVYEKQVVLDIDDAFFSRYADTNSMDPFLDAGANGIEIVPDSADDIHEGDVISYDAKYAGGIIVHRVVKKAYDGEGVYFLVKGDNNPGTDPEKVRFGQVKGVLVGIIY